MRPLSTAFGLHLSLGAGTAGQPAPADGPRRGARQCGAGLVEVLVAMAVLAIGLLGMVRYQAHIVQQGSESLARLQATQMVDQLLSLALLDPDNAACYTLPAGTCGSATARQAAEDWNAHVTEIASSIALGNVAAASVLSDGRLTVSLEWDARATARSLWPQGGAPRRRQEGVVDVRP